MKAKVRMVAYQMQVLSNNSFHVRLPCEQRVRMGESVRSPKDPGNVAYSSIK